MSKYSQAGIAQIVVVLIILAGLALGVYLVGQKTFFKPKAGLEGTRIEFVGASVAGDKTSSKNVKLRAYYIPPSVSAPVGGTYTYPTPYQTPAYGTPSSYATPPYQTPSTTYSPPPAGGGGGVYPTHFRVNNDNAAFSATQTEYEFKGNPTEIDWALSPGNGTKTVYAEFKINGVWGTRVSASITLAEPTVSDPVTPAAITAAASCAQPHDSYTNAHMDVSLKGSVPQQTSDGIWTIIKDETTGGIAYWRYTDRYQTSINGSFHDVVISTRGPLLKLVADVRVYTVKVYAEPYTDGIPTLTNLIAQTTFSKNCPSPTVVPSPTPTPPSTSKTMTYELYPGSNFIGLPFKGSFNYPVDKFLQATGGKCSSVWTTETSANKMYVYPKSAQVTDYFSNETISDVSKLDLQALTGGRGYFVECSSSAEVQLSGVPADLLDWESSIRQWVGVPTDQKYISYVAAPFNNQNLGTSRVKTLDLLNKATQGTRNCTEVLTPRVICTTSGEACSISGITSYRKNNVGNFTLRDDTGYGVKCVTQLTPSPSPTASPTPTLRPSPIPTLRPSPTPTSTPTPSPVACTACSADISKDGIVNMQDFSRLSSCFNRRSTDTVGGTSCSNSDLNGDRVVTILDYSCLASKFNQRCDQNITTQPRVSTKVVSNNPPTITSSVSKGFFTRIVITAQDVDRDNINVTVSKPANSYGPYCFGSGGVRTCYLYTRSVSGTITATATDGKGGQATTSVNLPPR